jgi:hypothetical protein
MGKFLEIPGTATGVEIQETPHFLLDWGLALFLAGRFEESAAV